MKSAILYIILFYLCFWVKPLLKHRRLSFQALLAVTVKAMRKGHNAYGDNIITWCLLIDLEVKSIEWA